MSTHKHFDQICCAVLALTLLLAALFVNGESLGLERASSAPGYASRLFDSARVHTLDIVMDDWDGFLANCKNEEYVPCAVVIDNEAYKNIGIRAKGNTSLTQVEAYGNNRYSFKIEFDHYDSAKTYYGLDKLCLNNIIQDNTYMKDYLVYQMMAQAGAASPLCSYVNITVNGEDWGLYLAVEGVEEAFLRRSYGNDYGELYKPDSTGMGGGRGNGERFDMEGFLGNSEAEGQDGGAEEGNSFLPPEAGGRAPDDAGQGPDNGTDGRNPGEALEDGPPEPPDGEWPVPPGAGEMPEGFSPPQAPGGFSDGDGFPQGGGPKGMPGGGMDGENGSLQGGGPEGMPGGGMGSGDVMLQYIDGDPDSYSNIFDNAKTDVSRKDQERLIASLQKLSSGEDLEAVVDMEAVIRYFAVHNFVLNFDSYTGAMIHNYYLYEQDGQMQMIPWDYNLAFGGFQSADSAASLVNYPIDSPVSGGSMEDRPMIAWIFASEEYTELYHRALSEFLSQWFEDGSFENWIDTVFAMIAPYVEQDPTKFCSYEEFETGVSTLKEFCLLRAESVEGQLNGSIGSTAETQQSGDWIDAGGLQVSDMGGMQNFMGGMGGPGGGRQDGQEAGS